MNPYQLRSAIVAVVLAVAVSSCDRTDPATYMSSARSYLAKADYSAAIIELKNALKDAPNNAEARYLLATAFLENNEPGPAETEIRKAIDGKYPADKAIPLLARAMLMQGQFRKVVTEIPLDAVQSPEARSDLGATLGLAYLGLDRPKEASAAIEAAIEANPDNVAAVMAKGRLAATQRDVTGALALVDAALAKAPNDVAALTFKAELLLASKKPADAAALLEKVVALRQNAILPRYALITNYIMSGQLDKAASVLETVTKSAPDDPRTQYAVALLSFTRGNMTVAASAIEKSVQAAPDYLPAQYLSGVIDLQRGAYASAEDSLRRVLAKFPDDDSVRRTLAETLLRRGQAERALEAITPSLERTPNDPALLRTAGEIALTLNNLPKATEYFEKATAQDRENVDGRVRLAQARLAAGDKNIAYRDLVELSALVPTSRAADLALVTGLLRGRDYTKALAAATALEQKQPNSALSYNIKGIVYQAKGEPKNARASFEKALSIDPGFQAAEFNLALTDLKERDRAGARKRLEGIIAKDPKYDTAYLTLAELAVVPGASPADAIAALERGIKANPTSTRLRSSLVSYLIKVKDARGAVAAAQSAVSALPESPQMLEILAIAQQAAGESDQALESMQRAAALQPDSAASTLRLAALQMQGKNYNGAIATLRPLMTKQPDSWAAWMALASAFTQSGRVDAGVAEARALQKALPDRAVGFALEGEIAAQQKRWNDAATLYRAASSRQPLPFAARRLHTALASAGKRDEAAQVAQKWLKEHPTEMSMRLYLVQLEIDRKDYKAAAASLRGILEIEPDNAPVLNNLAWALNELNDPAAIQYGEKAYALAPDNAVIADTYGWSLYRNGDAARATEILRSASQLDPQKPEYRLRLAKALVKSGDTAGAKKELGTLTGPSVPAPLRSEAETLLHTL